VCFRFTIKIRVLLKIPVDTVGYHAALKSRLKLNGRNNFSKNFGSLTSARYKDVKRIFLSEGTEIRFLWTYRKAVRLTLFWQEGGMFSTWGKEVAIRVIWALNIDLFVQNKHLPDE
jgi:hypothetical protein